MQARSTAGCCMYPQPLASHYQWRLQECHHHRRIVQNTAHARSTVPEPGSTLHNASGRHFLFFFFLFKYMQPITVALPSPPPARSST